MKSKKSAQSEELQQKVSLITPLRKIREQLDQGKKSRLGMTESALKRIRSECLDLELVNDRLNKGEAYTAFDDVIYAIECEVSRMLQKIA